MPREVRRAAFGEHRGCRETAHAKCLCSSPHCRTGREMQNHGHSSGGSFTMTGRTRPDWADVDRVCADIFSMCADTGSTSVQLGRLWPNSVRRLTASPKCVHPICMHQMCAATACVECVRPECVQISPPPPALTPRPCESDARASSPSCRRFTQTSRRRWRQDGPVAASETEVTDLAWKDRLPSRALVAMSRTGQEPRVVENWNPAHTSQNIGLRVHGGYRQRMGRLPATPALKPGRTVHRR